MRIPKPVMVFALIAILAPAMSPLNLGMAGGGSSTGLRLTMKLEKYAYSIGEELKVGLSLINASPMPISITFPTSQRFDFALLDQAGHEAFRWSSDKAFLEVITEVALNPGEAIDEELSWRIQGISPGRYTVRGETAPFFIGTEARKLESDPASITVNGNAPIAEFRPALLGLLGAGAVLLTILFLRRPKRLSAVGGKGPPQEA